ncbi:hypothetical protein ACAF76_008825 [Brevibacillus sp. TJ4]|uniref:hypothetical protein n=1 Tax=Brevibacillus sp. TJ4 TaxID=3234853 RepID=UPI0037D7BFBE
MSLKVVELQVALPRMTDVGRIQEQQLQRPIHEELNQQQERKQLDELNRQRPIEVNETEKNLIRERESREQKQNGERMSGEAAEEEKQAETLKSKAVPMRDPMRGRFIDISL